MACFVLYRSKEVASGLDSFDNELLTACYFKIKMQCYYANWNFLMCSFFFFNKMACLWVIQQFAAPVRLNITVKSWRQTKQKHLYRGFISVFAVGSHVRAAVGEFCFYSCWTAAIMVCSRLLVMLSCSSNSRQRLEIQSDSRQNNKVREDSALVKRWYTWKVLTQNVFQRSFVPWKIAFRVVLQRKCHCWLVCVQPVFFVFFSAPTQQMTAG